MAHTASFYKFSYVVIHILMNFVYVSETAKILAVIPTPSISHQVVFWPLMHELVKRGHEVTFITTDPAFPKGQAPGNLTEIDLHDLSYNLWRQIILSEDTTSGNSDDILQQTYNVHETIHIIFEKQLQTPEVKRLLDNSTHFDLLILEAWVREALLFSHVFKNVPVILISSLGDVVGNYAVVGAPTWPLLLYPTSLHVRTFNLSLWEKIVQIYYHYQIDRIICHHELISDITMKKILGPDTPTVKELEKNIDMVFLNFHPLWDQNRPVPPTVVYMGAIHQKPSKELPQDLQQYLDNSKNGVIYISYGTNVSPSALPAERIQMLVNVFSKLPYDVLWKWDKDVLPGQSQNIRISKWLPQSDLLKHPKVKLFITQGGLQSTDEAITAGVPLIGMPLFIDQWFNVDNYVRHKIGLRVDMDSLTEDKFSTAIKTVMNDDSYRQNIKKLGVIMKDQPQTSLNRAVWWMEHLIRHGTGKHLRAPAANMSWAEFLDVELLVTLALGVLVILISGILCSIVAFKFILTYVKKNIWSNRKLKTT